MTVLPLNYARANVLPAREGEGKLRTGLLSDATFPTTTNSGFRLALSLPPLVTFYLSDPVWHMIVLRFFYSSPSLGAENKDILGMSRTATIAFTVRKNV